MSGRIFMYVGNWGFAAAPKGISLFLYDEGDGTLEPVETVHPEIAAGQLCFDEKRKILYAVNECGERRGEIGGGGYVLSFSPDPETGRLRLINEQCSLSPEPSYLCMTEKGKYLIACHCSDPWHVTKITKRSDGSFFNQVLFDDTALVMFPINDDGSLGKPCDVMITPGGGGGGSRSRRNVDPVTGHIQLIEVISRLHSVVRAPGKNLFIACDKGMDRLITFKVDEEKGRFIPLGEFAVQEAGCFPRYGAFHPSLPVFYANNENLALLNTFRYYDDGSLELLSRTNATEKDPGLIDGKPVGAQDILISPSGKNLYISLCGTNDIAVFHIDDSGIPALVQSENSRGVLPRGLALSPDGRFLLSGNMLSGDITVFKVKDDGTIEYTGRKYTAVSPSAIRFYRKEVC